MAEWHAARYRFGVLEREIARLTETINLLRRASAPPGGARCDGVLEFLGYRPAPRPILSERPLQWREYLPGFAALTRLAPPPPMSDTQPDPIPSVDEISDACDEMEEALCELEAQKTEMLARLRGTKHWRIARCILARPE